MRPVSPRPGRGTLAVPTGLRRRLAAGALLALLPAVGTTGGDPHTLGLPPSTIKAEPGDPARQIALGRRLFMEPQLAEDGTMACARCHVPEHAFTLNGHPTSVGRGGRILRRNAPTVLNAVLSTSQFADGRMASLEEQVWGPLLSEHEAWNPTAEDVVGRLRGRPEYRDAFRDAFAGRDVSRRLIGAALAAYERSLVAAGSRFDRWFYGGDAEALDEDERRGFEIFRTHGCDGCHTVETDGAAFTDNSFRNTGIEWARVHGRLGTRKSEPDAGRYEVTEREADRYAFKVPTLRNVALTAPYMHDGSQPTLESVIDWYDRGAGDDPRRDPTLSPLGLTPDEKRQLVAFLASLTSERVKALAAEARAATSAAAM